jgi:hypothetical protein
MLVNALVSAKSARNNARQNVALLAPVSASAGECALVKFVLNAVMLGK